MLKDNYVELEKTVRSASFIAKKGVDTAEHKPQKDPEKETILMSPNHRGW